MSVSVKQKRSVVLLIAAIIATACLIYVISYMGNTANKMDSMSSAEKAGTGIAMTLATPSVFVSGIATLFTWLGWLLRVRGFALAAGILFIVAMALMLPWAMFNAVQMILCFVAYARMKKAG